MLYPAELRAHGAYFISKLLKFQVRARKNIAPIRGGGFIMYAVCSFAMRS